MKTTLDLPDELIREIEMRALEEDRTLTDLITELLRLGISRESMTKVDAAHRVKFPIILGGHPARPDEEIRPERAAEILLQQDVDHSDNSLE